MDRASSIYVIHFCGEDRIACFTVKHEAQTYIRRDLYRGAGLSVTQHKDAGGGRVRDWTVEEFLK